MTKGVAIAKMSGAGNDFVVLDDAARRAVALDWTDWVRRVCRRGLSVGADGVLVVTALAPDRVRVEFFNPDGGAAFCGNGSRCAARLARLRGLAGDAMTLETAAGDVAARLDGERVRLTLPAPTDLGPLDLDLPRGPLQGRRIDAGSPHFVVQVEDVRQYPLATIGPGVRRHRAFGERGTNFDVVSADADGVVRLRTWERGVEAETLACGSGAVAAAYALLLESGPGPGHEIGREVGPEARRESRPRGQRIVTAGDAMLDVTIVGPHRRPDAATLCGDARLVFEARLTAEAVDY